MNPIGNSTVVISQDASHEYEVSTVTNKREHSHNEMRRGSVAKQTVYCAFVSTLAYIGARRKKLGNSIEVSPAVPNLYFVPQHAVELLSERFEYGCGI